MQHPINELSADHLLELVSAEVFADEIEAAAQSQGYAPLADAERFKEALLRQRNAPHTLRGHLDVQGVAYGFTEAAYDAVLRLAEAVEPVVLARAWHGLLCRLGAMSDAALETSQAALDGECPDLAARNRRTHGRVHRELRDLRQASYVRRGERTPLGRSLGCRVQRGRGGGRPGHARRTPSRSAGGGPSGDPAGGEPGEPAQDHQPQLERHRHPVVVR